MAQQAGVGVGGAALERAGGGKAGGPSLVEWSPVYSNYFAYSSGKGGSGIDLYRVIRSSPGDAELLGPRGSITDGRLAPGQQLDHHQQPQQQPPPPQHHHHYHHHQQQQGPNRTGTMTFHESINSPPGSAGGGAIAGAAGGPGGMGAAAAVAASATGPASAVDSARARRVGSDTVGREKRMSFSSGGGIAGVGAGAGAGALLFPAAGKSGGGGGSGDGYDNSPENPFAGAAPDFHHHHHPDGGVPGIVAAGGVAAGAGGHSSTLSPFGGGSGGGGGMVGNPFVGVGGDGTPVGGGNAGGSSAGGSGGAGVPPVPFRAGAKNVISTSGGGDGSAGAGAGGAGGPWEGQGGGPGGEGDFAGYPLGPRKASSAFSEPGISRSVVAAGAAGVGMRKEWKYQLEGNSERWERRKDGLVTCMSWFPHDTTVGKDDIELPADIRMLAVGYASGRVELVRFPDECEHGERICVIPAEKKNRPCTAVAWDPENPIRLAAAWTKTRSDRSLAIFDIYYIKQWRERRGAPSARMAAFWARSSGGGGGGGEGREESSRSVAAATSAAAGRIGAAAGATGGGGTGTGGGGFMVGSFGSVRSNGSSGGGGGVAGMLSSMAVSGLSGSGVKPGTSAGGGGAGGGGVRRGLGEESSDEGEVDGSDDGNDGAAAISNGGGAHGDRIPSSVTAAAGGGGDSIRAGSSRAVGFVDAAGAADAASLGDGDGVGIWPVAKGAHGWESSKAAEYNSRSDLGLPNEGYASLGWLPGAGGADSVLLAGTGFKLLKIIHIRAAEAAGGDDSSVNVDDALDSSSFTTTATTLRSASVEAHKGAVSGIAVYLDIPGIVATWSDASGEPVKLWKARILRDIGSSSSNSSSSSSSHGGGSSSTSGGVGGAAPAKGQPGSQTVSPISFLRPPDKSSSVVDVAWCPSREDVIATVHSNDRRKVCLWDLIDAGIFPNSNKSPCRHEVTKNPISKVSWQPPRVRPRRVADSVYTTSRPSPRGGAFPDGGGGGGDGGAPGSGSAEHVVLNGTAGASASGGAAAMAAGVGVGGGRRTAEAIALALAEDELVAATFPQRMLTANSTMAGPFVENIGPWFEVKTMASSVHGDIGHSKGFHLAEGISERSGLQTRIGEDATGIHGQERGLRELADEARRTIARSGRPPIMMEVMKWRAQAQYRSDPVYNRDVIFDEELQNQTGSFRAPDIHPLLVRDGAATTAGASGAMAVAAADVLAGWHLWNWVSRVESLCADSESSAAAAAAAAVGAAGAGMAGVRRDREEVDWNSVGILDAGVIDLVAQEFEPPAASPGQPLVRSGGYSPAWSSASSSTPARRRHPTLGCDVFHTPGRARAVRACGWGGSGRDLGGGGGASRQQQRGGTRDRAGGGGLGEGGMRFASSNKKLRECLGVPAGLGELMRECEEQRQYPRSAALAVFHGDLRAAVAALRRAHDVTSKELQAASTVAALMPPAGPAAASHAQVMEARRGMCVLLDMMSMCIAGFHPPPPSAARRDRSSGMMGHDLYDEYDDEEEEDQLLWREKLKELLESQELQGGHPSAAYLRACCLFLSCVPEVASSQAPPDVDVDPVASGTPVPVPVVVDASGMGGTGRSYGEALPEAMKVGLPTAGSYANVSVNLNAGGRGGVAPVRGAGLGAWPGAPAAGGGGYGGGAGGGERVATQGVANDLAFGAILQDRALKLEDRTAVALMYLPTAQLKTFLSMEEGVYSRLGVLDGVVLTGMAHRGLRLMQSYIDRTTDIQTGALVATRSAALFPPSWTKEKEIVQVWATGYRQRLMHWQFWFNVGLFAKYCQRSKARLQKTPLSSEALSRLEAIRTRDAPVSSATRPGHANPVSSAVRAEPLSSTNSSTLPSKMPSAPGTTAAEMRSSAHGIDGLALPRSGSTGGSGGGAPSDEGPVKAEAWSSFGFGGSQVEKNFLRIKCNFCQAPVGISDSPADAAASAKARGAGTAGSGSRQGGSRTGERDRTPIVRYCTSCRNPLPRCFICLQQIGSLNPETEARRRQFDQLKGMGVAPPGSFGGARARGGITGGGGGRGGRLGNRGLPQREQGAPQAALDIWWSWCNVCNHGGHNGHLDDWFREHDTCGVRGCNCKCTSHDFPVVSLS
eukprot:g3416.t1